MLIQQRNNRKRWMETITSRSHPDADEKDEKNQKILFLGHLGTVPFDESEWDDLDPFMLIFDKKRQVAFGCGALDCKENVAALLAAAKELYLS